MASNLATHNVKNMISWFHTGSEFQRIGTIKIPAQEFQSNGPFCDRLSFNPWRTIPEQRSLGNLMRARLEIYNASLQDLSEINGFKDVPDILTGSKADA